MAEENKKVKVTPSILHNSKKASKDEVIKPKPLHGKVYPEKVLCITILPGNSNSYNKCVVVVNEDEEDENVSQLLEKCGTMNPEVQSFIVRKDPQMNVFEDYFKYFVENQVSGENPHEKLTPRMSALILMNHVKKGLELASHYKIPDSLRQIIGQHQGTTVMSFFYRKALNKNAGEEANEEDYRYPGPRPQSKEAAIVMLADAVEAATRALKDPTHSRLKGLIEDLVDERFQAGQLDESPLTLRDLERIKEQFLSILAGTFHARIEYPDKDGLKSGSKSQ